MTPVDTSQYETIVNALEQRYEGTILRGDEYDRPQRIPTGSLELDYITGGGIPMGRWTRMYGGWSSGKTRVSLGVIAEAQKMGLECAYYNVEKQYDKDAAERAGINTSALSLIHGSTIEEIGEKLEGMLGVAHLHVIDSCSNAISIDELDADLTSWRPGLMARAWGKVLRRAHERFDADENSVILIDQLTTNFNMKGGRSTEEPKGGKFLGYLSSMSLNFRRGKWLFYDKNGYLNSEGIRRKTLSGQDEPDGREILVRCEKSRVGRPELTATMHFDQNEYCFDHDFEYVKALKYLEIVEQRGSWWAFSDNGSSEVKVQGDAGLRELLSEHEDLRERVYKLVVKVA